MARATRSAAAIEKDRPATEVPPPARKPGAKKRKRTSLSENGEQPAAKHTRNDVKEEDGQEQTGLPGVTKATQVRGSGDVPLQASDAEKILDVLEGVDTQGLLDRVFPLPAEPPSSDSEPTASPSTSTQTYSFRALLKNSSQHPLRVLRAAVSHLFPISSHHRSRPSAPAVQQLRFCKLALSLLDQASHHSSPINLDVESIIDNSIDFPADTSTQDAPQADVKSPTSVRRRKYALVQRLPTGDWWTSANSELASPTADGKELKDLPVVHAELAAVLPSASTSTAGYDVTLGSYAPKLLSVSTIQPLPAPRRITCGRFLDYGPFSSFAPSFDQGGAEVGRATMGEVIWRVEQKRRFRAATRSKGKQKATVINLDPGSNEDVTMRDGDLSQAESSATGQKTAEESRLDESLHALLSPEEAAAIKAALKNLELEQAVQELLDRNAKALDRLEELQLIRLGSAGGGSKSVEPGSEEWDTAQGILDSLSVLASLRPRSSASPSSAPLIPSPTALRKLHRTLPLEIAQGWSGTLPEGRTIALCDDSTLHVRSGTSAVVTVTPVPTPPTAATTKSTVPPSTYNPYTYSGYTSQYRGGYGTFTPSQNGYYAGYANAAQGGSNYAQQYNATGSYTYPSWYNYQQHAGGAQAQTATSTATSPGQITPQTTGSSMPPNYASFFASAAQQPQPQRAVANTVVTATAARPYSPSTWGGNSNGGYVAPTLPSHLRPAANGTATPGTAQAGGTYPPYYNNYQMTSSTSR